jgi:hypothetical protein
MKKIPTAFRRVFDGHKIAALLPEFTSDECKNAVENGLPTIKIDGSCCAIIDGVFYKRYDAKKGKPFPDGAIKCQDEPDAITGHLPCWVKVSEDNPADKWFIAAYNRWFSEIETNQKEREYLLNYHLLDGTYEAIGKHFNGNPYNMDYDIIERHGKRIPDGFDALNSFDSVKKWLESNPEHEGLVWWLDNEPVCKLKRSDFGLKFPVKEEPK